jgi:DNA invertase Pin-like site-specific DNA recombinase
METRESAYGSVYAYLRVSSQGQVEGHGFDRQQDAIDKFCQTSGYEIAEIYRESASGVTEETERPAFSDMVSAILKNGVRTVVVESLDRLAREYRVSEHLIIYLASKGIDLISANTGENVSQAILDDPMKKALVQIQGIFAELDKSMLVKKLRKAREAVRARGEKCEGRKGYTDPEFKSVLNKIRALRARRGHRKQLTYPEVAERLNGEGIKTMTGRAFNGNGVAQILWKARAKAEAKAA